MKWIPVPVLLVLISCVKSPQILSVHEANESYPIEATVKKWYNGHTAAVSITYDIGIGTGEHPTQKKIDEAIQAVIDRKLRMDIEMVTAYYTQPQKSSWIDTIRTNLIPRGIHFFGHGHQHVNHDDLSYQQAYESFSLCFSLMQEWNLFPRVYAYPQSAGHQSETQQANRDAGFIAARGASYDREMFHICADEETEPSNWFYLPSVPVAKYEDKADYVRDHAEVSEILNQSLKRRSWIILMYHMIGLPNGWGFYPFDEYVQDLDFIGAHDFWPANFDDIAAYIYERSAFYAEVSEISSKNTESNYWIRFTDGLDNSIFNHPLTIDLTIHPDLKVSEILFTPSIDSSQQYRVVDNRLTINVLPDERKYQIKLIY